MGETVYLDDTSGTVTAGDTGLANAAIQGFADGSTVVAQQGTVRNVKVVNNADATVTDEGEATKLPPGPLS